MEATNEEENDNDLKVIKVSATLLAELERDLSKVLWKRAKPGQSQKAHSRVKKQDLDRIVSLIEPFQAEPQLLDAKLKTILPPLLDAYLQHITKKDISPQGDHVDLETAVCVLLYTLCKVRGYKVVTGFLNNEPRYLEPVLEALETNIADIARQTPWQTAYVLLLWLSHLLLTPFDLASISQKSGAAGPDSQIWQDLPPLTRRILRVGLHFLNSSSKAQDAAAQMIVRLTKRPDVQSLRLADRLVEDRLPKLEETASEIQNMYDMLGSLRLVAGISSSAELSHLIPAIYRTCEKSFDEQGNHALVSNAVAKKIVVKTFRNMAILSLRSVSIDERFLDFLQSSGVIENVIDYLLRSLADKDTPVRFAAAKAISLIVLELEPEMGHEVIQAVLDSFKEDMPRSTATIDFTTANPLKWHGLTLTLAHALFKRSASPEQLPDILDALIAALQFQQRTATGNTLGTNVRDAANFGIWSLSRRYTTAELLPVKINAIHSSNWRGSDISIIQVVAIQLILTACLDPAGNIRRGSSAALQELVGRHPDQVYEGIALVQIVDYLAVSLRSRAMIEVAYKTASLNGMYWQSLFDALLGWRGLGAADVSSRESAAASIAKLASLLPPGQDIDVLELVNGQINMHSPTHFEDLHGLSLTAALVLTDRLEAQRQTFTLSSDYWHAFQHLQQSLKEFTPQMLRSEFPAALAKYTTTLCRGATLSNSTGEDVPMAAIDSVVDSLLWRREEWILATIPQLVQSILQLKRTIKAPLTCLGARTLAQRVQVDGSKSTLHSAGRAIALGTLAAHYDAAVLSGNKAVTAVTILANLMQAMNVDWRIIGAKALILVADALDEASVDNIVAETLCMAIHQGLNDYTIDERGDVGSLVRLQSINCAATILSRLRETKFQNLTNMLKGDVYRLSLEKLDRVRLAAAQLRARELDVSLPVSDVSSISSTDYFMAAFESLAIGNAAYIDKALLEGCISCASVAGESLLQSSREALITTLNSISTSRLEDLMIVYSTIIKDLLADSQSNALHPSLELLAFLLDMQIPQRLIGTNFKWRNLLSTVQKSHHKSNDIPKILAAVHVYIGLAEVDVIRNEVLKKLIGMLKTNPYPRIRSAVVEALWMVTKDESLRSRPAAQNKDMAEELMRKYVEA